MSSTDSLADRTTGTSSEDGPRSDATDESNGGEDATEAVCPFCGSRDTELESRFGGEVSKSQYYCNDCRTVFERIKFDGATPATGRDRDGAR